ncbi:hypothetical protein ACFLS8_03425 [Chloroflexota bacterium]
MLKLTKGVDRSQALTLASQSSQYAEGLPDIIRNEAPKLYSAIVTLEGEVAIWRNNIEQQKELHRKWEKCFERYIPYERR